MHARARRHSSARFLLIAYFNGFLHTEEESYSRNVCDFFKKTSVTFWYLFYITLVVYSYFIYAAILWSCLFRRSHYLSEKLSPSVKTVSM